MKPRVYVETSVISYLAARAARDVVSLARQEMPREFWSWAPSQYELCCSQLTIDEATKGDHAAAARRLALTDQCTLLPFDEAATAFAIRLIEVKAVPITEPEDATHIATAIATLALVKYIASWNFSHMVGPQAKRQLEKAIAGLGHEPPLLATPEEIFEAEAS